MKSLIKTISVAALISLLLSNNAFAQETPAVTSAETNYAVMNTPSEKNNSKVSVVPNSAISSKFSTQFPSAINPQWTGSNNNFWVTFLNNGQKTTAAFNETGKMNFAITDLKVENIPGNLMKVIKNDYKGLNILSAKEIIDNSNISYQVILESAASFITLKSSGVEIEISTINNASPQ